MRARTRSSLRTISFRTALLLPLATLPAIANAQTSNPRVVEFRPSPDHNTVVSGVNVIERYVLEFYVVGMPAALQSIDLGKPVPDLDGVIRVDFAGRLGGWPAAGVVYEASVVATGPGGLTRSPLSNEFSFPETSPSPSPGQCSFSLSATARSVSSAPASGSFNVVTGSGCTWMPVSSAAWLTVSGGASRTGSGTLSYSVAVNNSNSVRMATISIGSASFALTQNGGCSYTLTPTSQGINASGGTGTVSVTTRSTCSWTVTRTGSWITITGGSSGSGNGVVTYRVSSNGGSSTRYGTLTIAGQPVTIAQSASAAPNAPRGARIVVVR